ncbi:LuxR family transcriptional regulator [Agrobacterium vitis]|uniref:LuxR family transcriptional regulator n=1 Tax=Agrobacterium vitis TaxID=373 RepID=A0A6L6VQ15_AGRVI|nr:helix-turn-helix transcriptional regulator [Agrobacterium vitis]MUZ76187.1 LuxR family transcriptional regulator [Agrobacterium vitis]
MGEGDANKDAILAVLRSETEAWLQRDFETLANHWEQSPQTRRMEYYASLGVRVDEGWDAIAARLKTIVERFPQRRIFSEHVRWDKVNVIVAENMAWVTYDQIGIDGGEDLKRELKILHRIGGVWKISCVVMMESTVKQANLPLIEVDADMRILWTNQLAQERIHDHQGLAFVAGRLRARRRKHASALRDTVRLAFRELQGQTRLTLSPKQAWAVILGEDTAGGPMHCWVHLEDGKTLVSFDDAEAVARRIDWARDIYSLSPAQIRLARLIVDGYDLAGAAELLGVSINTLRTQLQRIFDKTGARSQAALVRSLLSVEAPKK